MKLLPKFVLVSVAVCAVPMAIAGYSATSIGVSALRDSIEHQERTVARKVADEVAHRLARLHAILRVQASVLDLARRGAGVPRPEVLAGFLQLVYQQSPDFAVVLMLDAAGQRLGRAAFMEAPRANAWLGEHEAMRPADVDAALAHTPLAAVQRDGVAMSDVFLAGPNSAPAVILAVRYDAVDPAQVRTVVAQVSLAPMAGFLAAAGEAGRTVTLLDAAGRVVARNDGPGDLRRKRLPPDRVGTWSETDFVAEYSNEVGRVIGAYAQATPFPLAIAVEQPLRAALAPLSRMRWATLYWMGVSALVAGVVAAFLARGMSRRVSDLAEGARQIAQGELDVQLAVRSNDELGDLARVFNAMTTSLAAARDEILRQTQQIRAGTEQLEKRVAQKTQELRDAQDLLLRSRALAAIGALGAGVAHEINNPLTGVLGAAQRLLADLPHEQPERALVADIESEALRIEAIVTSLLRLAQRQSAEELRRLDFATIVHEALALCAPSAFSAAGIDVQLRVPRPGPPVRGSAVQLQTALIALFQNARAAMPNGGTLTIESSLPDAHLLRLRVSDTGRGIKAEHLPRIFDPFFTTKAEGHEVGMGLAMVHKIIEDHGGSVRAESEWGLGTTFWVTLPIASAEAAHLA